MQRQAFRDRTEWLRARQATIGSSEAASALGIKPSPLQLYASKVNPQSEDAPLTIPQRVGLALEDTVADLYRTETGREIAEKQVFFRSTTYPWMSATIDGLTPHGSIVEFKTISARLGDRLGETDLEQVPDHWLAQVHHQMIVAEKQSAEIAVLIGNEEFLVYPIIRNDELCDLILKAEEDLFERIQSRRPPEVSEFDACSDVLRAYGMPNGAIQVSPEVEYLVIQAEKLRGLENAAKESRDKIRALIAQLIGDAGLAITPSGYEIRKTLRTRKGYTVQPLSYVEMKVKAPKGIQDDSVSAERLISQFAQGHRGQNSIGQRANDPFPAGFLAGQRR